MSMLGDPDVEIELPPGGAFIVQAPSQMLALPTTGAGAGSLIVNNRVLVDHEVSAGSQRLNLWGPPPVSFRVGPDKIEVDRDMIAGEMHLRTSPATESLLMSGDSTVLGARSTQGNPLVRITDSNATNVLTVSADDTPPQLTLRAADALRLRGHGGFGITLSNPTRTTGNLVVEEPIQVVEGDLNLSSGSFFVAGTSAPTVSLESDTFGDPFLMSVLPGTGGEALYIKGKGRLRQDTFVQLSRNVVSGVVANISNVIFDFSSSASTESAVVLADSALVGRAPNSATASAISTPIGNIAIARADSTPEFILGANIRTGLPTPGVVDLTVAHGGALRFGVYGRPVGRGGPATFNDRFRVEDNGDLAVYRPGSTGSPGSLPAVTLEQSATADVTLAIGKGLRGRAVAKADGGQPGLLIQQGDDGQMVYWSAWRVGSEIRLRASLSVPTSAAAGSPIVTLP